MIARQYLGGGVHVLNSSFFGHQFKAVGLLVSNRGLSPQAITGGCQTTTMPYVSDPGTYALASSLTTSAQSSNGTTTPAARPGVRPQSSS